ncbi:MAG: hypothetical protein IJG63_02935, partial [Oscillospiraceae bacterium]|nr:hypothetical protein [Oscillospiraceae bacterium]
MRQSLRKPLALILILMMVISLVPTAIAAGINGSDGSNDSASAVTVADLQAAAPFVTDLPDGLRANIPLTGLQAIQALLDNSGLEQEQLGSFPDDYVAFALSLGMIDGTEDLEAICTEEQLDKMAGPAEELTNAVNAEALVPVVFTCRAQPICPVTSGAVSTVDYNNGTAPSEEPYSNEDSDIIRFFVYVETDYDTDGDGQLDLVKALVQLPRSAAEGNYQAAT